MSPFRAISLLMKNHCWSPTFPPLLRMSLQPREDVYYSPERMCTRAKDTQLEAAKQGIELFSYEDI